MRLSFLIIAVAFAGCAPVDAPPEGATTTSSPVVGPLIPLFATSLSLNAQSFRPVVPGSQVMVEDVKLGTGPALAPADEVVVRYTGWLPSGKIFDSTNPNPANPAGRSFKFVAGFHQVMPGWEEGLQGMRVGGVRRLVIPPALAYGSKGAGGVIPPDSPLLFEVELVALPARPDQDSTVLH